jgi:hypothetical protein
VSISSTLYKRLLRQYFCAKKVQALNLSTKKSRPKLLYEKAASKMLVKLTPSVNFINVLRAAFAYVSVAAAFFVLTF